MREQQWERGDSADGKGQIPALRARRDLHHRQLQQSLYIQNLPVQPQQVLQLNHKLNHGAEFHCLPRQKNANNSKTAYTVFGQLRKYISQVVNLLSPFFSRHPTLKQINRLQPTPSLNSVMVQKVKVNTSSSLFNMLRSIYSSAVYYISFERAQDMLSHKTRFPSRKLI